MQKQQHFNPGSFKRNYTAKEVAQYEYCPLVWWHEQHDPAVRAPNEELFAEMVAIEHEFGAQAPNIPDYQVIEQILVRRGAFEEDFRATQQLDDPYQYTEGGKDREEYAEEVESQPKVRLLLRLALGALILGSGLLLLSLLSVFFLSY